MKLTCVYTRREEFKATGDIDFVCINGRESIVTGGLEVEEVIEGNEVYYVISGGATTSLASMTGYGYQRKVHESKWMNCRDWVIEDCIREFVYNNIDEDLIIEKIIRL